MKVTLDDVVRNYMLSHGKNTLHGYVTYMKYMVDFLRQFSMNHVFMDNNVELKLDEKKAVQLPDDFISATKIAWKSGDRLVMFERDNSLSLRSDYCDDVGSATQNSAYSIFQSFPFNGAFTVDQFVSMNSVSDMVQVAGVGDNGMGYFRFNWKDREIQFDANVPSPYKIYIEYKSNGFNPKSKSTIPEFAQTPAEEYINWQDARRKFGDASAETKARKYTYDLAHYDMISALDNLNRESIVGAMARSTHINKLIR